MDVRIEDYLDDKVQTFADFEALDGLIASVQAHQDILKKQLQEIEQESSSAEGAVRAHIAETDQRNALHQAHKADLDHRLISFTNANNGEEARLYFEDDISKITALESADGYMQLWKEVDQLSKSIQDQLITTPPKSLKTYNQLDGLSNSLGYLENSDETALSLANHVKATAKEFRGRIQSHFSTQLEAVLSKILWPKPDTVLPEALQTEFNEAFDHLLSLQRSELEARELASPDSRVYAQPAVLLPLEIMAKPLATRFRYHFSGDRPTNRIGKPEYFLSHMLEALNTHIGFIITNVQPILFSHFKASKFPDAAYLDAASAFITSLLPMVRNKIKSILPQMSNQPQLLSHLIHELTNFDNVLRYEWRYDGGTNSVSDWIGLTGDLLSKQNWFDHWLRVEKDFALARYHSIVDDKSTAVLDYDGVESTSTKPTKAAIRVHDLLATITSLYKFLSSFEQKLSFLIDIQLSIFDNFHSHLRSGLEAFLTLTTSIGRTVQNVTAEDAANTQGIKGLERLCRIYGSAQYLENAMQDWGDDVLFLDLWVELQTRAKLTSNDVAIAGSLNVAEIAQKTSSSLTVDDDDDNDFQVHNAMATGALFDETAGNYARLRRRGEEVIIETLKRNLQDALRPYTKRLAPSNLGESNEPDSPSQDLAGALELLSTSCKFLSRAIANTPLRRILKKVTDGIEAYVISKVILSYSFSLQTARQLQQDVNALESAIQNNMTRRSSRPMFLRLAQAARLLSLETISDEDEGEGDAWGAVDDDETDILGLWQVERKLFFDNESARAVLANLGIETLTESEAREVIKRRVELQ